jgi:hypothetical protein
MPLMFHHDLAFSRETLRAVNHSADGGADLGKAVSTAVRINEKDLDSSHRDRTAIANQLRPVADNAGSAGHVKSATGNAGRVAGCGRRRRSVVTRCGLVRRWRPMSPAGDGSTRLLGRGHRLTCLGSSCPD